MANGSTKPVIFISFSHKDEPEKPGPDEMAWLTFVQSFLAPVVKVGIFDIWVDEHLHGGDAIDPVIAKKLADCDIFVLLVSRHSLASTYVVETEIRAIRQRQQDGGDVHMFPIVLSPTPTAALKSLKDLLLSPKDGNPLSLMSRNDREVAMAKIADDIAKVAEEIAVRKAAVKAKASKIRVRFPTRDASNRKFAARARAFVDIAHLPETPYERLVGRDRELKRLDDAWADGKTNILSLIAEGGAGKSALVNEWLKRMLAEGHRGAEAVLGWSFYSQGTKERATSAEQFLNWAMEKLEIDIETTSAIAKGEKLAEALTRRRVLLVLDGCEPLQHGLGRQQGELKDQGLRALLRRFASTPPGEARGLVVLTSRLAIKDITRWRDSSAPVEPVDELSEEAGAALLRDNRIWGTDKELQAASREFGGHPLALGLLASLLKETQSGDIRRRDHIRRYFADAENPRHDHARRVMESYEKEWLIAEPVEHAIMHMIGLFDRPASRECLRALCRSPAIAGLTDQLVDLDEGEWQRAVGRLRGVRLLAPPDPSAPDTLDAHPLVREWLGERLKQTVETAWKSAHGRIYEHLRDTTKEGDRPTLEDLAPLYQAIAHCCQAGRHQEAYAEVYLSRIDGPGGYAFLKLGAIGSELAAVAWFFSEPYHVPVASLENDAQEVSLHVAASCLLAEGRIAETIAAWTENLRRLEATQKWERVGQTANLLSDVQLIEGSIDKAIATSKKSIESSDRSDDKHYMVISRTTLANALRAAGDREAARRLFIDAEQRQQSYYPDQPLLHGFRGFAYCDSLIENHEWIAARDRAQKTITIAERERWLLQAALDKLTIARADLGMALERNQGKSTSDMTNTARRKYEELIVALQRSARKDCIPYGFLARAAFYRSLGCWSHAARDLDEVEEIAEPGQMKLFLCDIALGRARLAFANIEAFAPLGGLVDDLPLKPIVANAAEAFRLKEEAARQLHITSDYIKTCGYHRRDEELAELEAVLRGERKFADLPARV